jgi:hypothetical protein
MSLLTDLFAGNPKPSYAHALLGAMHALRLNGERTTWAGIWQREQEAVSVYLMGDEQGPSTHALVCLKKVMTQPSYLEQAQEAVIDTLRNADAEYDAGQFGTDVVLSSISIGVAGTMEVGYEQRDEPYAHFNAHFVQGKVDGVSVDT